MAKQKKKRLNWLDRNLPEGLIVDARWLAQHGYSTSLRSQYLAAGWLDQPTRGVYRRPHGSLSWQQVVVSLQTLLAKPIVVGGRTALELQGFAHYLVHESKEVHLYGPKAPPNWLNKLRLTPRFIYHNDRKLFRSHVLTPGLAHLNSSSDVRKGDSSPAAHASLVVQPWGQWDWPLTISSPERAVLELLDELPNHESFHQVDMLMQGMANLSPRRMQKLLTDCRSVKVKRLFFYFADRHKHAWLKHLKKDEVDLGQGKRMLVKGGKLNPTYQITVPGELDAVR
jgi:hypothetical protein